MIILFALRALGRLRPKPHATRRALRGDTQIFKRFEYKTLRAISVFIGSGLVASAQAQTLDQVFRDWSVFRHQGSCYVAGAPVKQQGNYTKRGQPYLLVVHKTATTDEVNASSGYPYAANIMVQATVNGQQFKLFTKDETAWATDASQDAQLVDALKKGSEITLRGTSRRGTWSEDTYSLAGFTNAYQRMKELCK
jgi:hypothetical protein